MDGLAGPAGLSRPGRSEGKRIFSHRHVAKFNRIGLNFDLEPEETSILKALAKDAGRANTFLLLPCGHDWQNERRRMLVVVIDHVRSRIEFLSTISLQARI